MACLLVRHGADLSLKNQDYKTPLDICPDAEICEALLNSHAAYLRLVLCVFWL